MKVTIFIVTLSPFKMAVLLKLLIFKFLVVSLNPFCLTSIVNIRTLSACFWCLFPNIRHDSFTFLGE